ncbi:MAG: hypothetical protein K2Y21_08675 [Phycisphaerales bacterium]|nr:hypothetical protein [Phycisphaerales bacterium]
MTRIDPNALRLAGAYQAAANRKAPSTNVSAQNGNTQSFDSIRRADAVVDKVAIARPEKLAASVSKLAAATVAGSAVKTPANPATPTPPAGSTYTARGTLSMFGQPGDRNTAATGVALGRVFDAQG